MPTIPGWTINLEDDLVMRGAVAEDVGRLSEYNSEMHREPQFDIPAFWIGEWTRDLFSKPHPRMKLDDIIIVEDTASGEIVSSTVYFDQDWSYCGISVPVGRPEIVSTHPDYRNRGLVRKQFELMERWGNERGQLIQGVTGIPYYYRQFGYEMALDMPLKRTVGIDQMPHWQKDDEESVKLRPATPDDLAFVHGLRRLVIDRSLFTPELTADEFGYQLFDRSDRSAVAMSPMVIEDAAGKPIGFMAIKSILPEERTMVFGFEFAETGLFREFTEPSMKALHSLLHDLKGDDGKRINTVSLELSAGHPAQAFMGRNFATANRVYAWYVRVPDVAKLLTLVGPKLEERLVGAAFEGMTGEKQIGFYRSGIGLKFGNGRLTNVSNLKMPERSEVAVNFPDLTFLHMLFGRKSFDELGAIFVDAYSNSDEDVALMDTLFPKMPSDMMFALS